MPKTQRRRDHSIIRTWKGIWGYRRRRRRRGDDQALEYGSEEDEQDECLPSPPSLSLSVECLPASVSDGWN